MQVAELFVRCLENEGVRYVFGVPGEETEDLLFALEDSPIEFVPTRHEQGAAFMANVWGRLTGQAGVCLATLGPGATNLVTGVADANLDKSPLVAITGQGGLSRLHNESHQNLDTVSMFRPITKWNSAIAAPETVTEVVRKAFKIAESEKPGATHVELSEDVAAARASEKLEPLKRVTVRRPSPDPTAMDSAREMLRRSRRPLVIAGNGAIRKLASAQLTRMCEGHQIPVVSTFMGKGAVSDRSEQSLLAIGLGFRDYIMEAVDASDLVITVGYDIAEYPPENWNTTGDKSVIHVDFDSAEVYSHYTPDVELVGDLSSTLHQLDELIKYERLSFNKDWYRPIRKRILSDIESYALTNAEGPMTIPGALIILREALSDDAVVISDVGSHKMWIARNFPTYSPNGCIISNGLASMGIAVPGAIAAALEDPGRQVVAATGDGGFLMNSQELATARHLGIGFTTVVFNDNDYGLIAWKQRESRGRTTATQLTNPDFRTYAESFGVKGYRATDGHELREMLETAVGSGDLALIEVPVDPSVNFDLLDRLEAHWTGESSSAKNEEAT